MTGVEISLPCTISESTNLKVASLTPLHHKHLLRALIPEPWPQSGLAVPMAACFSRTSRFPSSSGKPGGQSNHLVNVPGRLSFFCTRQSTKHHKFRAAVVEHASMEVLASVFLQSSFQIPREPARSEYPLVVISNYLRLTLSRSVRLSLSRLGSGSSLLERDPSSTPR